MKEKVVFVRTDKIGDLVSTLPVDEIAALKDKEVFWLIGRGMGFIALNAKPPRAFFEIDLSTPWKSFFQIWAFLRQQKFSVSCFFQGPWWLAFALKLAGVPLRGGRKSQWYSFLFFNRGIRQSRSKSEKHEADYNLDLVTSLFSLSYKTSTPVLSMDVPRSSHLLEKLNLQPKNYYVVHPGMAGSALNWPIEHYQTLIDELTQNSVVAITGTAADEPWLKDLKPPLEKHAKVRWLQGQLSSQDLLMVLKNAKAVVGPSTGVMHLSASLDTKTIAIYSPVKAQLATRWGPRGNQVTVMTPNVECPAESKCLGTACKHYLCLSQISPQQIVEQLT